MLLGGGNPESLALPMHIAGPIVQTASTIRGPPGAEIRWVGGQIAVSRVTTDHRSEAGGRERAPGGY
jgi:hypothetical protein